MKCPKTILCCFLAVICARFARAQENKSAKDTMAFCVPRVQWMPRTKGVVFKREYIMDYGVQSISNEQSQRTSGEVALNARTEIKLKAPILNKPNLMMAVGFRYFREDYAFDDNSFQNTEFFEGLQEKPLRSLGATLYMVKPFRGNTYFMARLRANLTGSFFEDDNVPLKRYLRFSFAPMYGWKTNERTSFAVGAAFGVDFGRYSIYPLFQYNQSFNKKWGIETLLPVHVRVRYTPTEKNVFYLKSEVKGANYLISMPYMSANDDPFNLQRLELRYLVTWEREIYDFLWVSVEAGVRSNMRFNLRESVQQGSEVLISNHFKPAPMVNFSIFLVPPRKFTR